jgi:hypothetical protein
MAREQLSRSDTQAKSPDAARMGRSALTGQFVLTPVSKPKSVSDRQVKQAVRTVLASKSA